MALVDDLSGPPDPFSRALPIVEIERGTTWWRIHRTTSSPVFFGPAPGGPPTYRFDAPGGEYRILYLGQTLSAAFVETLLRNPRIPFVERTEIEIRSASALANDHALKLVDLRGGGLSQIGAPSPDSGPSRCGDTRITLTAFCTVRSTIPTISAPRSSIRRTAYSACPPPSRSWISPISGRLS